MLGIIQAIDNNTIITALGIIFSILIGIISFFLKATYSKIDIIFKELKEINADNSDSQKNLAIINTKIDSIKEFKTETQNNITAIKENILAITSTISKLETEQNILHKKNA